MKTYTTLKNLATNLSNNTSSSNDTLLGQLISDQHRYLIQKYFANERTYSMTTVGSQNLTLASTISAGATSATLASSWSYITAYQLVTFSSGEQRNVLFTNGSTALSWSGGLTNNATTTISAVGVQFYPIPANISKITNDTINVGQLRYQPIFVQSRQEWDNVNFLPYNSDIPQYCFIYNGGLGIWPIPSTTGNLLNFNYKTRVPDLSYIDYTTGHIANGGATVGSTSVTGSGTSWSANFPIGVNIQFANLFLRIDPPYGDGIWYPIQQFTSDTALTLATPILNAPNISASTTYTIGQLPLLEEDFHDMLVYGSLMVYYSTIVKDMDRFKMFDAMYKERLVLLEEYAGSKNVSVDLEASPQAVNPNLFFTVPNQ